MNSLNVEQIQEIIPHRHPFLLIDKIEQISIADLISEAIIRIHEKRPLSPLFEMGHK